MSEGIQVGDRVRVVQESYVGGPVVGEEGVVVGIEAQAHEGIYPALVQVDGRSRESGFYFHEIALIEAEGGG